MYIYIYIYIYIPNRLGSWGRLVDSFSRVGRPLRLPPGGWWRPEGPSYLIETREKSTLGPQAL